MNAVERMRAKLSSWAAACRGFCRPDSILDNSIRTPINWTYGGSSFCLLASRFLRPALRVVGAIGLSCETDDGASSESGLNLELPNVHGCW